jgi:N6-adenosine-specific RNA methylase IME4
VDRRTVSQFLITIDDALRALAEARTPEQLIDLSNTAETLRRYAQRAQLGMVAQNKCAELRLRAERRLGDFLTTTARLRGRPKSVPQVNTLPRLSDFGITDRKLSHRAQRLSAISAAEFERYLKSAREREWEITTRQLLYLCERRQAARKNRQRIVGGHVSDLVEFAQFGNRMGTILIDPPWATLNALLPYSSITPDELQSLPIPALAAERCHLHMWATANNFVFDAKDIIESWGFRVVGNFVWVKPQLGRGNYWRQSHEILLTAVRGADDRFDDLGLRSWIAAPRGRHSEKPDAIHELIERASPGPRLEIYARQIRRGWFGWGHEIAEPLTEQATSFDEPVTNDRFFTKRPLAQRLYEITRAKIAEQQIEFDCWLEPAAGDGAFFDLLPPENRLGIDLDPGNVEGVVKLDFLSYSEFRFRVYGTIGNPPFGKNANIAIKFFNRCAKISSFIAFILPRTFRKDSVVNKLDENFHLLYEESLPDNSFEIEGQDRSVPTVFQIWVKRPYRRARAEILTDHEDLEFLPPEKCAEADILFQRVGVSAGTIKFEPTEHSPESHFCLKCSEEAETILQTINWNLVKHNTAGNPSISKSDVLKAYIERKHELRYTCLDFYVVERDSVTYLVRNQIWTAIDRPDLQADEQRFTVSINGILHEFPGRNEFDSFISHFEDYLGVADGGSRRRRSLRRS